MKKLIIVFLAAALICTAGLTGCSGSDSESKDEKSVAEKVADKAVKEMRAPIEKANDVKQRAERRLGEMQQKMKE